MIMDTEALLYDVREHFNVISEVFNSHELIDNNVRISTDLFQQFFNMSVTVAGELMYLEKMDNELSELVR